MRKPRTSADQEAGSRAGRPKSVTLRPEHAELVRQTVRKMCAYYGVKIRDLGKPSKWIIDAMRTNRPMSVAVAERLYALAQCPDSSLVGGKNAKGPSQAEVWDQILKGDPKQSDRPEFYTPAAQYFSYLYFTGLQLARYTNPMPGAAFFVLPGAAEPMARDLTDLLPLPRMNTSRKRLLVESLSRYLKEAEQPLTTSLGERLIPRLVVLGTIRSLKLAAEIQKKFPADADPFGLIGVLEGIVAAEERRGKRPSRAQKLRKKRRVVMPKVRALEKR